MTYSSNEAAPNDEQIQTEKLNAVLESVLISQQYLQAMTCKSIKPLSMTKPSVVSAAKQTTSQFHSIDPPLLVGISIYTPILL